ncbi:unnamed protein product, partial [marine sediment metagenome]
IEAVGNDITEPPDAVVIDLGGKFIYPGLIDLYTHYGISENLPEAPGSGSLNWNIAVHPERNAAEIFKPDENEAKALRKNGFTSVVTFPRKGIFRGYGTLVLLSDSSPNEAVLSGSIAQSISMHERTGSYPRSLQGRMALIRQTFLDAMWYSTAWEAYNKNPEGQNAPDTDLSLESLQPLTEGVRPAVFEAPDVPDIYRASMIAGEFGLNLWVRGCGSEYRRLKSVKDSGVRL